MAKKTKRGERSDPRDARIEIGSRVRRYHPFTHRLMPQVYTVVDTGDATTWYGANQMWHIRLDGDEPGAVLRQTFPDELEIATHE